MLFQEWVHAVSARLPRGVCLRAVHRPGQLLVPVWLRGPQLLDAVRVLRAQRVSQRGGETRLPRVSQ